MSNKTCRTFAADIYRVYLAADQYTTRYSFDTFVDSH